jgi:hypothetical protein
MFFIVGHIVTFLLFHPFSLINFFLTYLIRFGWIDFIFVMISRVYFYDHIMVIYNHLMKRYQKHFKSDPVVHLGNFTKDIFSDCSKVVRILSRDRSIKPFVPECAVIDKCERGTFTSGHHRVGSQEHKSGRVHKSRKHKSSSEHSERSKRRDQKIYDFIKKHRLENSK